MFTPQRLAAVGAGSGRRHDLLGFPGRTRKPITGAIFCYFQAMTRELDQKQSSLKSNWYPSGMPQARSLDFLQLFLHPIFHKIPRRQLLFLMTWDPELHRLSPSSLSLTSSGLDFRMCPWCVLIMMANSAGAQIHMSAESS